MVNRYAAMGIALDAATEGKRIIVITRTATETRDALNQIAAVPLGASCRRTAGSERISYPSGGEVIILSHRSKGARGYSADVLYLDEGVDTEIRDTDKLASLMPCLTTSRSGEIIRSLPPGGGAFGSLGTLTLGWSTGNDLSPPALVGGGRAHEEP